MSSLRKPLETVPETEVLEDRPAKRPLKGLSLRNLSPDVNLAEDRSRSLPCTPVTPIDDRDFWSLEKENIVHTANSDDQGTRDILAEKLLNYMTRCQDAENKLKQFTEARDRERKYIVSKLLLLEGKLVKDKKVLEKMMAVKDKQIMDLKIRCSKLQEENQYLLLHKDEYEDSAIGSLDNLQSDTANSTLERLETQEYKQNLKRNVTDPDKKSIEGALAASKCRRTNTAPGRYCNLKSSAYKDTERTTPICTREMACQTVPDLSDSNPEKTEVFKKKLERQRSDGSTSSERMPQVPPRFSTAKQNSISASTPNLNIISRHTSPLPLPRLSTLNQKSESNNNNIIKFDLECSYYQQPPTPVATRPNYLSIDSINAHINSMSSDSEYYGDTSRRSSYDARSDVTSEVYWTNSPVTSTNLCKPPRPPKLVVTSPSNGTRTFLNSSNESLQSQDSTTPSGFSSSTLTSPTITPVDSFGSQRGYGSLPRTSSDRHTPKLLKKPRMYLRSYSTPGDLNMSEDELDQSGYSVDGIEDHSGDNEGTTPNKPWITGNIESSDELINNVASHFSTAPATSTTSTNAIYF